MSAIHKFTQTLSGAQIDIKLQSLHASQNVHHRSSRAGQLGTMTGWQDIKYETGEEGEKTSLERQFKVYSMTAARGQFVRQFTSAYEACAFFFPPQGRKLHFFLKGTCRQCVKNKDNLTGTKCCPIRLRSLLGSREEPPPAGACTTGGVGCNWSEVCVWQPCLDMTAGWGAAGSYLHPSAINTQATNASEALLRQKTRLGEPLFNRDWREGIEMSAHLYLHTFLLIFLAKPFARSIRRDKMWHETVCTNALRVLALAKLNERFALVL